MRKPILTFAAIAALAAISMPTSHAGEADGAHPDRKARKEARLVRFDTDGDGSLSAEERAVAGAERAKATFAKLDGNNDGYVDQAEWLAARQARHAKVKDAMLVRFDANEDGTLTGDERGQARRGMRRGHRSRGMRRGGQMRDAILKRFDANEDGTLDESERAAAREAVRARRLERFDTNGDGTIDESERPQRQGGRRGGRRGGEGRRGGAGAR